MSALGVQKKHMICVEGSSIQVTSYLCHHCFTRGWRIVIGVDSTVHVYDHLRTCLYVCSPMAQSPLRTPREVEKSGRDKE